MNGTKRKKQKFWKTIRKMDGQNLTRTKWITEIQFQFSSGWHDQNKSHMNTKR